MQVEMQNAEALNRERIHESLKGSRAIQFTGQSRAEKYACVERVLVAQQYARHGKRERAGCGLWESDRLGRGLFSLELKRQKKGSRPLRGSSPGPVSGSFCVGIDPSFQDHPWIGKCSSATGRWLRGEQPSRIAAGHPLFQHPQ
jgi:hypothetical protein